MFVRFMSDLSCINHDGYGNVEIRSYCNSRFLHFTLKEAISRLYSLSYFGFGFIYEVVFYF